MLTDTYQDVQANDRLTELGLSPEILIQAVTEGQLALSNCTKNDPRIFPGLAVWSRMNRSLREQLIPLGWIVDEKRGQPITLNIEKKIAIIVFSGDNATGYANQMPQPRNPKGNATQSAVEKNRFQLSLFPEYQNEDGITAEPLTWVLLYFRDKNELRCEFSLPHTIQNAGKNMTWAERIILPEISLGKDEIIIESNDEVPVIVDVTRKLG